MEVKSYREDVRGSAALVSTSWSVCHRSCTQQLACLSQQRVSSWMLDKCLATNSSHLPGLFKGGRAQCSADYVYGEHVCK